MPREGNDWLGTRPRLDTWLQDLRETTPCPYAGSSQIVELNPTALEAAEPGARQRALQQWVGGACLSEQVLAVRIGDDVADVADLALLWNRFVREFSDSAPPSDLKSSASDTDWRLRIASEPFFALIVSPIYAVEHPRHIGGTTSWALLQHDALFARLLPREKYDCESRDEIKVRIRQKFLDEGLLYVGDSGRPRLEARRHILNETAERGVEWWSNDTAHPRRP